MHQQRLQILKTLYEWMPLTVSRAALEEVLWGHNPPLTASSCVTSIIADLRKELEGTRLWLYSYRKGEWKLELREEIFEGPDKKLSLSPTEVVQVRELHRLGQATPLYIAQRFGVKHEVVMAVIGES